MDVRSARTEEKRRPATITPARNPRVSGKRRAEIATLKKHIINYLRTRSTYEAYRETVYSRKFFETHREELTLHKAAKLAFDELEVKKLPKVKELNAEYA